MEDEKEVEALELETLEVETRIVEADVEPTVKVTPGQMTEAEIETRYQAHLRKIRGGK